ncbi:multicapsid nucleopolyhedrovirus inhibitor of apoptosis protein 3-like protein [Tomelloso virus]|uniref:Multicapsid nucleopolyhedrovirus inhibitor of apoptosis protein 3-like protein n=1 Tax=Tomelloso virus TaxID=2053981 RepID=A0A2H4T2R6_9VIRU|nr:multicapsid nucleopolyhedrovirus inhibitor of apoptosis protein 3-like protein [Tomelloso virus]ATY70223.1 multicapsid nucleopolyhedrovirus inhibitor of apoptosis protein 3-like protein [Tomelloso virus]
MSIDHTKMNCELTRRDTFKDCPVSFIDGNILAKIGFIYLGFDASVECHFCKVRIHKWQESNCPISDHIKWSPNCPLIRRAPTNNIPIDGDSLNNILPEVTYDECGARKHELLKIAPKYPQYMKESDRLESFEDWPISLLPRPEELSDAGFFYDGTGDRVKCFSCDLRLKDWSSEDRPWEQHALWSTGCHYLDLIKGREYIDFIKKQKHTNEFANIESAFNALSIEEQDNVKNEERLCKICRISKFDVVFVPCGHVICVKCSTNVTTCPMCRSAYEKVIRIYY